MGTKAKLSTKVISVVLSALMAFSCVYVALPSLAPKAFAAKRSASRITETGWQRLSSIFIELTSTERHFSPRKAVSSGLPRPRLCPGTSKGTRRAVFIRSKASKTGALSCDTSLFSTSHAP